MSITIKTKYIILTALIAILVIFFGGWYIGHREAENAYKPVLNALTDEINRYELKIRDSSVYISEKKQEILTLREAKRQGDVINEELRKLNIKQANEITRLKLRVDTLLEDINHTGQVVYVSVKDTINQPCMLLPFTFQKKDQWLDLKGSFNKEGKMDMGLKINANLDIWAVIKKKKASPTVIVTTDNPYISVIGIKSIKLETPRDRRFGIGVSAGYGITSAFQASPFFGVGLNYNVIKF